MTPPSPYDIQADGPTRHGPRKRRKVTRSKLGCLTCRKRKKLCDMEHPTCSACTRLGKECEWPDESSSSRVSPAYQPDPSVSSSPAQHPNGVVRPSLHQHHTDSTTTVDDFTEIFGMDNIGHHIPTPPHSSFFPMFANNFSLDTTFDRSGMGEIQPHNLLADRVGMGVVGNGHGHGHGHANGVEGGNEGHWDASSILDTLFNPNLDEATLQFWTSGCLNPDANTQTTTDQNLSDAMFPPIGPPPLLPSRSSLSDPDLASSTSSENTLIRYHQFTLLPLITTAESADPFTLLAESQRSTPIGTALQNALIALSARHLANKGEMQHEVLSQKKEELAKESVLAKVAEWELGVGAQWGEDEKWTLLAAILTLLRVKQCRGDVWDYESLHKALRLLSSSLYPKQDSDIKIGTKEFALIEHLIHHDMFSSFVLLQKPLVPTESIPILLKTVRNTLTPLLGISFPLVDLINRTLEALRRRRSLNGKTWDDDEHLHMVELADDLQDELRDEKKRLDALTKEHPNLAPHRFLHEALRTACLLMIRGYILTHAPEAIDIGLLVRQNLSLLETMQEQKLPGLNMTHWVLFMTALNCVPSKNGKNERGRVMALYQYMIDEIGFGHFTRSKRLVEEIWSKNLEGEMLIDWVDILEEWSWEMFFV